MKKLTTFLLAAGMLIAAASLTLTSCTKEGPQGPAGKDGTNGTNGKDANETCKLCHAKEVVDSIAVEFQLSKHNWGSASFEEAGNPGCGPCHESKAFIYVCKNNIPSTFTFANGKWNNDYSSVPSDAIGEINCFTCHSSLHTTYGYSDIQAFTNTSAVAMTMWGGAKTINLTQDDSKSNLCVKCHQPRPLTLTYGSPSGRLFPYDTILQYPNMIMWDSTTGAVNKFVRPSYRMHIHYGAIGAVYAGQGGIEFTGSFSYSNSPHATVASCQDCHMATPMYGIAGGHAFNMRNSKETALGSSTTWNFAGCNKDGCHAANPLDANSDKFKGTRAAVKALLDNLAAKINAAGGGVDIMHKDTDGSTNLWAGVTTNNYDGYLDIYDASSNPSGYWRNPSGNTAVNLAKPKFPSLKMVQLGAIINFQLCLREYSLGIHNTQYTKALLTNSIDALNAAGL
jgi:hypothetical protein